MDSKKSPKIPKFICEKCGINTNNKKDFNKHMLTPKHNNMANGLQNDSYLSHISPMFECSCGKIYQYRQGLYKHKKNCGSNITPHNILIANSFTDVTKLSPSPSLALRLGPKEEKNDDDECSNNTILELLKQNQDFKELMMEQNKYMIEQNKQMIELAKNAGHNTINNTNNTNNTKFNLQFFLNDTCKDAMNITDFVNSLVLDFEDLENMGHLGYVEGISRIFLRGVRGMDVSKRPFHCSDIKRETMFVKDMEGWEKENSDNEKMTTTIKRIACKNLRQATAWMAAHQKAIADTDSKPHSQYMKMMSQCLGGATAAEDKLNYNKIIRRVAQEVFIDKNKD